MSTCPPLPPVAVEARHNSTARRDALLQAGAHLIATDYPGQPSAFFPSDYQVPLVCVVACSVPGAAPLSLHRNPAVALRCLWLAAGQHTGGQARTMYQRRPRLGCNRHLLPLKPSSLRPASRCYAGLLSMLAAVLFTAQLERLTIRPWLKSKSVGQMAMHQRGFVCRRRD